MFGLRVEEEFINDASAATGLRGSTPGWALLLLIIAGLGTFVVWAMFFEIEEVTRGMGRVVPSQQVQIVQNLEGGIVRSISVSEGEQVEKGQVLLVIDDTAAAADRGSLLEREVGLLAEEVRLRAEVDFDREPEFPPTLQVRGGSAVLAQMQVLNARFESYDRDLALLESRLEQKLAALDELTARLKRLKTIIAPLNEELELTERLAETGGVPFVDLLRLRGRMAEIEGDLVVANAQIPALESEILEARREIEAAHARFVLTARQRLAELGVELAVVREALRAAQDRVTRTQLLAPASGIVNAVNVSTVGQVAEPGRPLVEIVPVNDTLEVEVNIQPKDVAFIKPGDQASVKITAYDYVVYGALLGEVARIGADTILDAEGREYFQVVISTKDPNLRHDSTDLPMTAGMQASVDIQTGTRTVMSYLLGPVFRLQTEALRER